MPCIFLLLTELDFHFQSLTSFSFVLGVGSLQVVFVWYDVGEGVDDVGTHVRVCEIGHSVPTQARSVLAPVGKVAHPQEILASNSMPWQGSRVTDE